MMGACDVCKTEEVSTSKYKGSAFNRNGEEPRTWELCFVCASTLISASDKTKYDYSFGALGGVANILLDAIVTGQDPRNDFKQPGDDSNEASLEYDGVDSNELGLKMMVNGHEGTIYISGAMLQAFVERARKDGFEPEKDEMWDSAPAAADHQAAIEHLRKVHTYLQDLSTFGEIEAGELSNVREDTWALIQRLDGTEEGDDE